MVRALSRKRRRDFARRRWQYLAVATTLSLGVMLFAASYDAYRNLDASYRGTYGRLAFADMTVTGARSGFLSHVRGLPGVAAVSERQEADVPMRVTGDRSFIGRLVGMPPSGQPFVDRVQVTGGDYLAPDRSDEVVVEAHMAAHFGLRPGDEVRYFDGSAWHPVKVRGVAVSPEYLWPARSSQDVLTDPNDFGVLFVSSDLVQTLPEALRDHQALILYDAGADRAALDAQIGSLAQRYGAHSAIAQAEQPSNKALQLDVLGFREMAVAFPVMFLIAAGMAAYTLLTRLVYSEREVIGTLRANGLSRGQIEWHYLSYGLFLGVAASVIGLVSGVPLGWALTTEYTAELGIPDTLRSLHVLTPVVGVAFGVITGLLASFLPARSAAALDPAVAMRGFTPVRSGRRSVLESAIPQLRALPVRWRMVLRGIGRNPRRSLSTILGVVLALVLVLASWGLIDTTQILLDRQFQAVQLADATVVFEQPVSGATVRQVAAVPGVVSAETVYALSVTVRGSAGAYPTQLLSFQRGTSMHGFTADLPYDGVLLGTSLRDKLGVKVGDEVLLSFGTLHSSVRAKVGGFVAEPLGTFVYASHRVIADLIGQTRPAIGTPRLAGPDIALVMVRFVGGVQPASVITRLQALDGVATVSDSRALYRLVQQYMGLFYVFSGLMLVFGGIMAFALVFNTMSVNLAERSTELATMRANGLSQRRAAWLLVGENLLLTAVAIPPGLLAGYAAASALMASYSSDLFDFSLHMHPATFVWSSLAMLAVAVLSLIPGVRAAARIDIASVVRERAL